MMGGAGRSWRLGCLLAFFLVAQGTLAAGTDPDGPVPLIELQEPDAPRYSWLTPEQVTLLEAGGRVFLDEIPGFDRYAPDPLGELPLPYTRIRPGSPLGYTQQSCTANYVFQQGERLAIGNAGHCTQLGRTHQAAILDLDTLSIRLLAFGTTIMRIYGGLGTDFAIIEVDPELHHLVHPAIAGLDGPCGSRAAVGAGDPIQYHGHGVDYGYHGQNRHGAISSVGANHISYHRLPGGAGGDSGSPVRYVAPGPDDPTGVLPAAGINTHGSSAQMGHGTSMPRIFELIEQADIGDWELVMSPNCPV